MAQTRAVFERSILRFSEAALPQTEVQIVLRAQRFVGSAIRLRVGLRCRFRGRRSSFANPGADCVTGRVADPVECVRMCKLNGLEPSGVESSGGEQGGGGSSGVEWSGGVARGRRIAIARASAKLVADAALSQVKSRFRGRRDTLEGQVKFCCKRSTSVW